MKIFLCRHGNRHENGFDAENPVRLTPGGWKQAAKLADWLAPQDIQFVFSSPKIRAIETAIPTAIRTTGRINVWPLLIEHDSYGPLDWNESAIYRTGADFIRGMCLDDAPKTEDFGFAYQRACAVLSKIRELYRSDRVAIFAHDCFNSVFIWAWLNRGALAEADRYYQDECCVNILEDGKDPQINLRVF